MALPPPTPAPFANNPNQLLRGIVKLVNSGDSVVIRGPPRGGPPPERNFYLSNITAPRLGRRPGGPGGRGDEGTKDEPWAWEAREFLRKKLVGREVVFTVEYKVPTTGREYGVLWLGRDQETGENVTEAILAEGLVSVRKESKAELTRLLEIEEEAKIAGRGRWGVENAKHIRDVTWNVEPQSFMAKVSKKPIEAVVEHVRDGSTIRCWLLPSFHYVTVMMSGIRTPGFKMDSEGKPDPSATEPYAEQARYFTESRLLQQNVNIILESVNGSNFVGSVIHPNGNIAELLLREGFARCIDWSMGFVTGGAEKLRSAEKYAKDNKLRIWANFQESQTHLALAGLTLRDREFSATVVEIGNGDSVVVKTQDGSFKKLFLASIRPPRQEKEAGGDQAAAPQQGRPANFRPLYDIPFMFEAREVLRKKLIGKRVQVTVDYIQPAANNYPEKICCTIKYEGINMGEALLSKGLATVVRYGQTDDRRASDYDLLLAAEAKAQKAFKGIYGKKDSGSSMQHVVDITGDAVKAKQFLPFFKRAGKTMGIVEFVASGSRLRIFVPREMRIITFLLGGISCAKADRTLPKSTEVVPGDPYGNEARNFTKEMCLHREVEIEVDDIDKAGNFIGWLWIDNRNLSVALVEEAYASVHFSAEKSTYFRALKSSEDRAKERHDKIWKDYVEVVDEVRPEDERQERKVDFKSVVVTEVTSDLRVYVQFTDDGDKLESLTNEFRRELNENPPMTGAYTPRKDAICAARFSQDGEWYRAKIEKELPDRQVSVFFIDYGNREVTAGAKCAALPGVAGASAPGYAKEYSLACLTLPTDEEYAADAVSVLRQETGEGKFQLNVEYKVGNIEYVTLVNADTKEDVGEILIKEGLVLVENRKERRLQKLMKDYKAAEKEAKTEHRNVWEYGDITEDDAREFGMAQPR